MDCRKWENKYSTFSIGYRGFKGKISNCRIAPKTTKLTIKNLYS